MAFGVKSKTIKTKNSYTVESLFEAIKDKAFSAGAPTCEKYGPSFIITFPALDRHNQVQIISNSIGGKKPSQKFTVQKAEALGLGKSLVNDAMDSLTGGLFRAVGGMAGDTVKRCEALVDETAKELEALGL